MRLKRYCIATVATFAFIFVFDWFVHGYLLRDLYEETSNVWRREEQLQGHMPIFFALRFALAALLVSLFARGNERAGLAEGARYGLYIGLIIGVLNASIYPFLPVPATLAYAWFFSGFFLGIGSGLVIAMTYNKPRYH